MRNFLFAFIIFSFPFYSTPGLAEGLDGYKTTCKAIGFSPGTERFGDCVLKLRKKDLNRSPLDVSKSNKTPQQNEAINQYVEQAKQYFINQQALYDQQMALYAQQKKDYDERQAAIKKEKQEEAARKLTEFGLRMAAGTSPNAATNINNAWRETNGLPPLQEPAKPTMQAPSFYSIQTPNGFVYCSFDPNSKYVSCN